MHVGSEDNETLLALSFILLYSGNLLHNIYLRSAGRAVSCLPNYAVWAFRRSHLGHYTF